MSSKVETSSKWRLTQLLNRNRSNPAWINLARVMKASSDEFGLMGRKSENYETAITQVMNHFDALKPLVNDEACRAKIGHIMIHNVQKRLWSKRQRKQHEKEVIRQSKLRSKNKGPARKALKKREKDVSTSDSQVKIKHGLKKSTKSPAPSNSQPVSPAKDSKLSKDAEMLLVHRRPLPTWKRLMALMRMTSENLGVEGLQDEKSSVAIAGIMVNFAELRPHMDDARIQHRIRRQMINNMNQRLYHEKKRESLLASSPKMKKTGQKQKGKKGTLKVKTLKMSAKGVKGKPTQTTKDVSSSSVQSLLPSVKATKKLHSTQLISELSVKAKQLLFYRHPHYTHQRLLKMMRQTGDDLGVAGLRSSDGLAKIIQIMKAFPQLQPYVDNVHVLKKLQAQMIVNLYQRKRNKMKSQKKAEETTSTVSEDTTEIHTSCTEGEDEDEDDKEDDDDDNKNTDNSTRQVATSESEQELSEDIEAEEATATSENKVDAPLSEKEDRSDAEKDEAFQRDKEKEKCVLGSENTKEETDEEEEEEASVKEAEDVDVKEDDQTIGDEEEVPTDENRMKIVSPENEGNFKPDVNNEEDLNSKNREKDADKTESKDKIVTDEEENFESQSDGENAPPSTENQGVHAGGKKMDPVVPESQPLLPKLSKRSSVGKSSIKISTEAKSLLIRHRPYATWKQFRDLMRSTADELGLERLREPAALENVKKIMRQIPQLQPYVNVALLQQRVQKKMIFNLSQRIKDHAKRYGVAYQPKEHTPSTDTKWRQTRLLPVKRKNLKDITDNNEVSKQHHTSKSSESPGSGKCWCQRGKAATWTHTDIMYRTSGSLPWRHLMNVMKLTSGALNVSKKSSENYDAAVLEVMNHFPGLRRVAGDVAIRKEIGKRMIKNDSERRRNMRRKMASQQALKAKGKFLKRIAQERKRKPIKNDDQKEVSENSGKVEKREPRTMGATVKKCWCQKKAAVKWTYNDILIKTMGNEAWRHFAKIMRLTARDYNITKKSSVHYNTAVTEVINHFPALRPLIDDKSLRREIGKKMVRNHYRMLKRHGDKSPDKESENSITDEGKQDNESNVQKPEKRKISEESESNVESKSASVKKPGVKKCWCLKESSTWTCNDLLVRTPENPAWRHFVKVMMDTGEAYNVTKKSSVNYEKAITEVMNHFPALRLLINDDSVQQKIGERMIKNNYERYRKQALREKSESGADEGLDEDSEKTDAAGNGQKPDSIKESQIFEVEAVLKYAKDLEGGEWYYVKWAGYASDQNTWEPKEHLTGCSKLLKKFHRQLKRAKLTHSGRKRKLSDEGLVVGSKKPKCPKPISPVSTEALRAMVQEELRNWAISLNYICSDTAPIVVENEVDFEGPPTEFTYINDYISGAGVKIPNDPLVGCDCESCSEEELECCPQNSGVKFAYNRLKHIRVKPGTPIYECNKYCRCGEKCPNRVVQLGRKYPMAIFRTANGRGWGVKTLVDIRRNTFVMEYVGEVITNEEAERRGKEYDANGRTYLFDLDYNDDDCPFTVDAGKSGNISHFVNHSCDPNLVVYGVWVNCVDPRLPRIALFANRDIKAGEELTFDYQMTGEVGEVGDLSADVKVQHVTCRCGASNCRGFLV